LMAGGVKMDLLMLPPPDYTIATYTAAMQGFLASYPNGIGSFEGPNETNIWPVTWNGSSTLAASAQFQQAFYSAIRAIPAFNNIPVFNTTIGSGSASVFAQLGNIASACDYANSHPYSNDMYGPQYSYNILLPLAQSNAVGKPEVVTETGYNTDLN